MIMGIIIRCDYLPAFKNDMTEIVTNRTIDIAVLTQYGSWTKFEIVR